MPPEMKEALAGGAAQDAQSEKEEPLEAFDWGLYSALIRKDRKDLGYRTADAFSATVYRRTRIVISRDSVYKIEQGKQIPDALQFMAINISLYKEPLPSRVIELCYCPEWREIWQNGGEIPISWKYGNFLDAAPVEHQHDPDYSPINVAVSLGEPRQLFANPNPKPAPPAPPKPEKRPEDDPNYIPF